MQHSSHYIKPLASFRFFAAFFIVVFHVRSLLPFHLPTGMATGVSFFFVLSGFILTQAYGSRFDIRQFYLNRFARLWPTHLLCFVLVACLLMPFSWQYYNSQRLLLAFSNITLIHAWFPFSGVPFSFNGPSWSISAEFAFYALFPFLVTFRYPGRFVVFLLAATLLAVGMLNYISIPAGNKWLQFNPNHLLLQFPLTRLVEFALGVYCGRRFLNRSNHAGRLHNTAMEAGSLAVLLAFIPMASEFGEWLFGFNIYLKRWFMQCGGMFLFAGVIYIFAAEKGAISKWLSHPLLVKLGEISFCTYMLHHIVIRWWIKHDFEGAWYMQVAVILAITYAGSWLMHYYWEKPVRRFILNRASIVGRQFWELAARRIRIR